MRVFITGGSGWIGSAVVAELTAHGHEVTGIARSDRSADALAAAGATVVRGSLDDLDVLRAGAAHADAVVHLGFKHDDVAAAGGTERAVVEAFLDELDGSGKAFLFASGVAMVKPGELLTEDDASPYVGPDAPRGGVEQLALAATDRGLHPVSLRFAPTVHGDGDHGFTAVIADAARAHGASAYVGDGSGRWPAVHRSDAARLVRLALEQPAVATVVHVVAEEGIPTKEIAEALAARLGVPTQSITPETAQERLGWVAWVFAGDMPTSSALTRERYGWEPTGPTLLDDIAAGHYTRT